MPQAVVHVLFAIIALDLIRDHLIKDKKKISLHYVFIGGVAGLLPDIDIPIYWLLKNVLGLNVPFFHRLFTHTIFFGMIFLAIAIAFYKPGRKVNKTSTLFAIVSFGIMLHILLDFIFLGTVMPFYPLSYNAVGLDLLTKTGFALASQGLEAIFLLWWLWHEEKTHKISDFI